MKIEEIKEPGFLKQLSIAECNQLAQDIRTFLMNSVSKTGGHVSSNLGVVELTIALHKVFDSPKDKIFFDVGHQSYIHKILTGRAKDFATLRQTDGLSGFQKRAESQHDVWEAGHSSTSLSAALGMAVARDLNHEDYCVVPVIGDGAMSSGMSLEALNQIGSESRRIIIIFNDNNMSISQNVGALTKAFSKLRTSKPYTEMKQDLKSTLKTSLVGRFVLEGMSSVKDALKDAIVNSGFFEEFGCEYLGPIDGHNISDLCKALQVAKNYESGPIVVHVITKKGKGIPYCENDSEGKWHGCGPFDVVTGKSLAATPKGMVSWSQIFNDAMLDLSKQDEKYLVLTPAMMTGSKLETYFAKYPERAFDCGIAEEHTLTFAASLALSGKRPFVSVYSSFLQRAYDQINHDICRMDLPVVIGVDRCGLVGEDGDTHHGVFDISILRSCPNLILSQPKDADEARNLLYTAMQQSHPFVIRYPRGSVAQTTALDFEPIEIGSWQVMNDAPENKIVIFTYGPDTNRICAKIETNQLPVTVVNCRFFKPLDGRVLHEFCNRKIKMISFESDVLIGGLGSSILEWANDHDYAIRLHRLGIRDNFVPHGSLSTLKKRQEIDLNALFKTISELL